MSRPNDTAKCSVKFEQLNLNTDEQSSVQPIADFSVKTHN